MKTLCLLSLLLLGFGCKPVNNTTTSTNLTLYTYASLADQDYGLLPKIIPQFEQEHDVKINIITFPDTGSMLNQLIQEQNHPKADIVMGLDNLDMLKAEPMNLFSNVIPFDYGYVAFVYDSENISFNEPISLLDLGNEKYAGKVIITQPGVSSPGSQLLAWTYTLGDQLGDELWSNLERNGVIVAPDWGTAYYTMFLNGEAPIVLSYLTSPAYHIDQEGNERYKTIPMKEGYLKQTENIALVNGSQAATTGQQFMNYVTSTPVQQHIATTQWMWPVDRTIALPEAYSKIITPTEQQILPVITFAEPFYQWLDRWNTTFKIQ